MRFKCSVFRISPTYALSTMIPVLFFFNKTQLGLPQFSLYRYKGYSYACCNLNDEMMR